MNHASLFKTKGVNIHARQLTRVYDTAAEKVTALKGVDFKVDAGQAVAIMGPSGCGKTTLMNLVGGVDKATDGTIRVGDVELTAMSTRQLEMHRLLNVGFVFQFFNLVSSMTARENLELPMLVAGMREAERHERAQALLDLVGLGAKADKRPDHLSGGEQQRVGVAVALANDPPIILADEPTGNLDAKNASAITNLLVSLASEVGKTVIMVSHDPKCVAQFPVEYAMRDGQFVSLDEFGLGNPSDARLVHA